VSGALGRAGRTPGTPSDVAAEAHAGAATTSTIDAGMLTCPAPLAEVERVILGHGSGGQLSAALLRDLIGPALGGASPGGVLNDAAVVEIGGLRLAFTTDSYVVSPIRFPGGDIGELAVNGTVNDLAMMGAAPVAISLAYVIEEGLPLEELRALTASAARAADRAGVRIVTGDTKVVGRGAADGLFVNTAGIGLVADGVAPSADRARPGDAVILSGPIGLHGVAVMSVREGLEFEVEIASDTRPLNGLVAALLAAVPDVHVLRDPTRGGLASALNEIAAASGVGMVLDEPAIPIPGAVRAACEMLGLDPLHVANEGMLVAIVPGEAAGAAVAALRSCPGGEGANVVGAVVVDHPAMVTMRTIVGSERIVDMLVGEQLPRIC
jgi:hydrogenase expression/formation protein HypE